MRIDCLTSFDAAEDVVEDWEEILSSSCTNSVFLTWEWVTTWWSVFGKGRELRLLVARGARGVVQGIAPLMIHNGGRFAGREIRHLMIVGQRGATLAEHLDFIIRPGFEEAVSRQFLEYVFQKRGREWDTIWFERVPADSVNLTAVRSFLKERHAWGRIERERGSPFLRLPTSWDALLKGKSRHFRSGLKNAWNRLNKLGVVRLHFAGRDLPAAEALEETVRLNRERWGDAGTSFRSSDYLRFHRTLVERFAARGWLLLVLMSLNGEMISSRYDFIYGGKLWCFQGGWKRGLESISPGKLLIGKVLEWGIENGLREYDFLAGDAGYKDRWAEAERTLVDVWAANPRSLRGRLFLAVRSGKRLVRERLAILGRGAGGGAKGKKRAG